MKALRITSLLLVVAANLTFAFPRFLGGESRIVNGTAVPPGKYPEMVSLKIYDMHNCGGTILNEYWVLTAAHCLYGYTASYYEVYSGSVDLKVGGTVHKAVELIWHEKFDPYLTENDIALVKVDTPFAWDANHGMVSLPEQSQETPGGSNATVVGWGLPYSGGDIMNQLQEVDYWTVTDEECMAAHHNVVFETNICAYYPGGGKGQCSGDSGGPLYVAGQQVGIVSWSVKPCTVAPYPGVFTQVSPYIGWIQSKISN